MVSEESWDMYDQAIIESAPFALPLLDVKGTSAHTPHLCCLPFIFA